MFSYCIFCEIAVHKQPADILYEDDEFMVKPFWAKVWILSAGVLMNILLAFVIFCSIGYYQGNSVILNEPLIAELQNDMPAKISGIQSGDRITSVNDKKIETWELRASGSFKHW